MTQQQADTLLQILTEDGYEADIYSDYSGRFMFGDTTIGVAVHDSYLDYHQLRVQIEEVDPDFPYINIDQLGVGYILY